MVNDFIKSIRANMYERTASPLAGAFFAAWFVWNYEMIFVLFSELPIGERIEFVKSTHFPTLKDLIYQGLLGPLISAIAVLLLYPFPARWIYQFWRGQQKLLKEVRQRIENETLLSTEESRKIRRDMLDLENKFDELLRTKELQLSSKQDDIDQLQGQRAELREKVRDLESRMTELDMVTQSLPNEEQTTLLGHLGKVSGQMFEKSLRESVGYNELKFKVLLRKLEESGYVESTFDDDGVPIVQLTDLGSDFAINAGLV